MKIHEEELTNFCQHQHKVVQFTDGLNAIIGANGSGKSNLLGGLRYALTGDHPNKGGKDANIRKLSTLADRSKVRVAFSHAGTRAEVIRHLRPAGTKTELIIEGRPTITGDARANAEIMEILGINPDILNSIAIVAQANIFGFLDQTPGKRSEAFQKLFQTDIAGFIYDLLTAKINKLTIPDVAASLDTIRQRHTALQENLRVLRRQAESTQTCEQLDTAQRADQAILAACQQKRASQAQHTQLLLQMAATIRTDKKLSDDVFVLEHNIKTLQAAADGVAESAQAAQKLLLTLEHKAQLDRARQDIANRRDMVAAQRVQLLASKPVPPDDLEARFEVHANIQRLKMDAARQQQFLASFDPQTGVTECYVCHTPVTGLHAQLEQTRQEHPVTKQLLAAAELRHATHVQYDVDLMKFNQQSSQLDAADVLLNSSERGLGATPEASGSVDELKAKVAEHADFVAAIAEYAKQLAPLAAEDAKRCGVAEQQQRQLTDLETMIAACQYTDADEANVTEQINVRTRVIQDRRQLDSQLAVANAGVIETGNTIVGLEQEAYRAAKIRARGEFLQRMRDPVHNAAAPKVVATRNIQRLVPAVNEVLATFAATFNVAADESLSFIARFADGTDQPADRLSGGQKVVLALAFLLSVNFRLAANLGFLGLDEPTAYLDEHYIRGFAPVLDRLRTLAASRGLQCIIVTHEASLAPLFDSVVRL